MYEDNMLLSVECPAGINVQNISDICEECEDFKTCVGAEPMQGSPRMPEEPPIELSLRG